MSKALQVSFFFRVHCCLTADKKLEAKRLGLSDLGSKQRKETLNIKDKSLICLEVLSLKHLLNCISVQL